MRSLTIEGLSMKVVFSGKKRFALKEKVRLPKIKRS
jgi:hypothetical protein